MKGISMITPQSQNRVSWFTIVIIFLMTFVTFLPSPLTSQTEAASQLGGLNLSWYCDAKYDVRGVQNAEEVLIAPYDAFSWRCQIGRVYIGIDTNEVCRWQYGSNAFSATNNPQDPYSWYCYRETYVPPHYA